MTKKVINNKTFVRLLSDKTGYSQASIKEVIDSIDDVLFNVLQDATNIDPIEVKLTSNISIGNKEYRGSRKVMPSGVEIIVQPCFRTYARFHNNMKWIPGRHVRTRNNKH